MGDIYDGTFERAAGCQPGRDAARKIANDMQDDAEVARMSLNLEDGHERTMAGLSDLAMENVVQAYGRRHPDKVMSVLANAGVVYNANIGACQVEA